ncbi:hypothetical protein M440DRAFT_278101 [Trichoderma longibrachiatum ATCC 18648]|uniref:Uncharacterized protein n=1 Tax=Trichoderma longibrachiatum ATCC 18648 TaxID=983965 RepID=A0A2T4C717_TRILO|nr:hypothetical protein M440DRAFT_278101 [Trichoderma longibrachiatum ATCC 18648]
MDDQRPDDGYIVQGPALGPSCCTLQSTPSPPGSPRPAGEGRASTSFPKPNRRRLSTNGPWRASGLGAGLRSGLAWSDLGLVDGRLLQWLDARSSG